MPDSETVNMREAASMLDVSLQHVYRLVWEGRLSAKRLMGSGAFLQTPYGLAATRKQVCGDHRPATDPRRSR